MFGNNNIIAMVIGGISFVILSICLWVIGKQASTIGKLVDTLRVSVVHDTADNK